MPPKRLPADTQKGQGQAFQVSRSNPGDAFILAAAGHPVAMRTLEFRLYPTRPQAEQLEAWLLLHRRLWNYGLALLQELDSFSAYDKASKARVPCCPLPWSYRFSKPTEATPAPAGQAWLCFPYSEIRRHPRAGLCCPIPQDHRPPRLSGDSYQSLTGFFSKKNHPNWPELQGCPKTLIRGTLQALGTAWAEHKKGKRDSMGRLRKPPRFKSARFPITTLSDTDCKKSARVDGDTVRLPVLGEVRIKGNRDARRWPADRTVCTYRLQREPSGWYLLLVGEVAPPTVRATALAVGIDAGVTHTLTTSEGKHIDGPAALAAALRKLERLQQQMARQTKGGANWRKTVDKIKRQHETIRRTRKLFAHKATTYLLRTYGTVAIEDLKVANMIRRPAPKPAEDGQSFLPNQAKAKGGLNRFLSDAGLGQLRVMLEAKGAERGRLVVAVNPAHTSQCCSVCGHTEPGNRLSQEDFCCLSCGYRANADVNAARNILEKTRGG
jgi:putative transposase